jgi:hypothetical protein
VRDKDTAPSITLDQAPRRSVIPSSCVEWAGSQGNGTAARHLRETGGIDNRIDNESATPLAVDSAAREHRPRVPITPRFRALAFDADLALRRGEREVSTTKRQGIDNCL